MKIELAMSKSLLKDYQNAGIYFRTFAESYRLNTDGLKNYNGIELSDLLGDALNDKKERILLTDGTANYSYTTGEIYQYLIVNYFSDLSGHPCYKDLILKLI